MTSRARWLMLSFATVGLAFASVSAWVHYKLLTDPTYISPCDINTTFNCTQAYLSRFGSVFGVPVALGGVVWFALVALITAFATPAPAGATPASPAGSYVFALSTLGLAVVLYLGYASWFVLKTACLLCLGTYASVIAIFVVSGLSTSVAVTGLPLRVAGDLRAMLRRPAALVVAVLFVLGAASAVALFPREMKAAEAQPPPQDEQARFAQAWALQPRIDLGLAPGAAKVVIVKFNDWLCGGCKGWSLTYEPLLTQFEKDFPGAVKYVVKDWPWNSDCNVNVPTTFRGHEGSCDAAVAVRLARDKGKERAMADWLFSHQDELIEQGAAGKGVASQTIRAKVAELLGIQDFDREAALKLDEVRRDVVDGNKVRIESTPTYFVNGVRTTTVATANDRGGQNLPPQYFDMGVRIEIGKPGGKQ